VLKAKASVTAAAETSDCPILIKNRTLYVARLQGSAWNTRRLVSTRGSSVRPRGRFLVPENSGGTIRRSVDETSEALLVGES